MTRSAKIGFLVLALALGALLPLVLGRFHVYLLTEGMIYAIFGVSFYLLLGHTGFLSLGHAAYFGIGGYVTALCLIHLPDVPLPVVLLAGTIAGLISGLIIGAMLLRLTKIYYSFATLAFSQMLWAIAWKWRWLTGGDDGLTGWSTREIAVPLVGQFGLTNVGFLYYLVFLVAVASILLCWYCTKTPFGNTLASIKSNTDRVGFLGVNTNLAKFMIFGFSGMIAGLAGSLFVLFKQVAAPGFLDMFTSFDIIVISIVGGYLNFAGVIVGSFIYVYLSEYLSSFTERWQLIMGVFFILVILYFPGGVVGVFQNLTRKIPFLKGKGAS